jgi:hypothetical protein
MNNKKDLDPRTRRINNMKGKKHQRRGKLMDLKRQIGAIFD